MDSSERTAFEKKNKSSQEILPVTCMDIGNLLADDSARLTVSQHLLRECSLEDKSLSAKCFRMNLWQVV